MAGILDWATTLRAYIADTREHPDEGDLVQECFDEAGKLKIPCLRLSADGKITCRSAPAYTPSEPLEFKVLQMEDEPFDKLRGNVRRVREIHLEFVRRIPIDELKHNGWDICDAHDIF